ncbi:SAM-dependent methyltransferase [Paenibacillus albiflavus]|uniref:SAM-dependent methyltransferase n=1 Tax=Paenibacillus albiflavus TaxID=2545760 RepID=A0A4R4E7N1_9BACL|nr:class I SAM-dependent methyltransferase [Paenibacillus albiflavus]TCZ75569.1 SAM-dependent methyltransferase [Paenibacillus albiflavus]
MIKLSKRLQMIAERVPQGARLADIGSDHALLPTYLVQQGMISFAIAGEVNSGPLDAAMKQVSDAKLENNISPRLGNGLEVVEPGEVNTITIAGMGGSLIASILEQGKHKLEGVKHLILQPNVGEEMVRRWLLENGWFLTSETILEEDGKIYEILTAVRETEENEGKSVQLYASRTYEQMPETLIDQELLMRMGPYFIQPNPSKIWIAKWQMELAQLERIRQNLAKSDMPVSRQKEEELANEIRRIQGVLTCMQKVQQ